MDIRRKAARLVMPALSSRDGDDSADEYHRMRDEVVSEGVGGCIVFGGNVDSVAEMLAALSEESPHPLLVGSDLERGLGQQLEGGTLFPCQMALGACGHSGLAYAQGCVTAVEATAVGINLVFAPVADVNTEPANPIIGTRSYGEDPAAVATMTAAFVRGCQLGGAGATAKHFPGHGATTTDSHIELPTVEAPRELIERRDLEPFRAAVDNDVAAVMTAHVLYPSLGAAPATFSHEIVGDLLRQRMGHDGLVVTDALLMGAVTETMGQAEAAVAAVEAGADVLLAPEDTGALIAGLEQAVRDGRVAEARLDESIARIERFLGWAAANGEAAIPHAELESEGALRHRCHVPQGGDRRAWGDLSHDDISLEIARRAVTLVRDDGLIPLRQGASGGSLLVVSMRDGEGGANPLWLTSGIETRAESVESVLLDRAPSDAELADLAAAAGRTDVCVVAVFDEIAAWKDRAVPSGWMSRVGSALAASRSGTVVVGFTTPHAAPLFPEAASYVCCYDTTPHSQTAAAEALFGEIAIEGRLPVAVSTRCPVGHGLSRG